MQIKHTVFCIAGFKDVKNVVQKPAQKPMRPCSLYILETTCPIVICSEEFCVVQTATNEYETATDTKLHRCTCFFFFVYYHDNI